MKKILTLAIILLNLLAVNDAKAQNYSSEMGMACGCGTMGNYADIYSSIYDGNYEVAGNQNSSGSLSVGYYDTYTSSEYPLLKDNFWFQNQKYQPPLNAVMCMDINQYYQYHQNFPYECVACSAATLADLMGAGNSVSGYKSYEDVYWDVWEYTGQKGVYFLDEIPNGDSNFYYDIIHNGAGLPVENCSDVRSYIDNGSAVLGVRNYYPNCVVASPSGHMVTIVGYDDCNYYCIDPGCISPQVYPACDFNSNFFYGYSY